MRGNIRILPKIFATTLIVAFRTSDATVVDNGVSYIPASGSEQQTLFSARPTRYIVQDNCNDVKVKQDLAMTGGTVLSQIDSAGINILSFKNTTGASAFSSLGYAVEEDVIRYPMRVTGSMNRPNKSSKFLRDLQASVQVIPWGINKVFNNTLPSSDYFPPASNITKKICIIDGGVWPEHPDLVDITFTAADSSQKNSLNSGCSHGTHVTGTVAADNNKIGVMGIFPAAPIIEMKVFSGSDCGWTYASDLIVAVDNCVKSGASIISMSLGGSFASKSEKAAFAKYRSQGVLSFAAAGNDGVSAYSYPASYDSVISVGATDENNKVASFSQFNNQVDVGAPGVSVLSTVVTNDLYTALAGGELVFQQPMEYSKSLNAGIQSKSCVCTATSCDSTACSGKICIIPRGSITFAAKAQECENSGGIAAIIYNNADGFVSGTLGSADAVSIPVFGTSDAYGSILVSASTNGDDIYVDSTGKPYAFYDGTSMATPHASGVAYLLWNKFPSCSSEQIVSAILTTGIDLGDKGTDNYFGQGLLQYWPAAAYLQKLGC